MIRAIFTLFILCIASGCATTHDGSFSLHNRDLPPQAISDSSYALSTPPRRIKGKAPLYPISLMLSDVEGEATIVFTVGTDGRTKNFEVETTTDERFANHAIIAVGQWLFEPGQENGVPVEVRVSQTFTYR